MERRSGDSGAWSVTRETARTNAESDRWTTERVDVQRTRRVRTCLSLSDNKTTRVSTSQPCPLPSFVRTLLQWCQNQGRKPERRRRHVISDEFAICGCHPVTRGTPSRTSPSAAGHEGGPGTPFLRPRPKPAAGPRAVPELDGPGGSGWGDSTSPTCPPTCRCRRWDRRTTRRRFSTSSRRPRRHVGGPRWTGQCASFHCCPGEAQLAAQQLPVQNLLVYDDLKRAILQRVGRNPKQTSPALPIAGAGGKRPALRDGSPAPGRVPQMAVGRRKQRRPDHRPRGAWNSSLRGCPRRPRSGSSATARPSPGPGHPNSRRNQMAACHGVGESLPCRLSLSLLLLPFPPRLFSLGPGAGVLPRAQPRWRGGPAPESAAVRAHAREAGSASPSSALFPVPPGSPRQFLGPLPATRVAGKPGPALLALRGPGPLHRSVSSDGVVGTLVRVPDAPQAAPDQAGGVPNTVSIRGGVLIGLWWIQDVTKPRSIKA